MPEAEHSQEESREMVDFFPQMDDSPEGGTDTPGEPTEGAAAEATKEPEVPEASTETGEEDFKVSKSEWEKLQQRLKDKDSEIGRQGNEIGELRKARESLKAIQATLPVDEAAERERLNDLAMTDPVAFQEQLAHLNERKQRAAEQQQIVKRLESLGKNKQAIEQFIPDLADSLDDIAALLKEDGVEDGAIDGFKAQPWQVDPAIVHNLKMRAVLNKENATLKAEVEKLKQENAQLKSKPGKVLDQIERTANSQAMNGGTGDASKEDTVYGGDPFGMSLDQLRKATGRA